MKKYFFILFVSALVISACQQTPKIAIVDMEAEKAALDSLFQQYDQAFLAKDVAKMSSFLAEDLLCMGTDPTEFWNKQQLTEAWTQMLSDTLTSTVNFISKRNIKIAADGKSACVTDQFIMPYLSPNIPWRNTLHLVKIDDNWKILVFDSGFIPKNEDIQKLNEALAIKE